MLVSIVLVDRNFSANDVDIMIFEPGFLIPPWVNEKHGTTKLINLNQFGAELKGTFQNFLLPTLS